MAHAGGLVQLAVVPGCALALLAAVQWPLLLFALIPLLAAALLFRVIRSPRLRLAFEQRDRAFRQLNDDYRQLARIRCWRASFPVRASKRVRGRACRAFSPPFTVGCGGRRARRVTNYCSAPRCRPVGCCSAPAGWCPISRWRSWRCSCCCCAAWRNGDGDGARRRCIACGDAGRRPHSSARRIPEIRWERRSTIASAPQRRRCG
ncbi:hypothetical protein M8494_25325 [Serratia ureilytica]